jgi:ADP-heptose:LPS heptosyltransferase
MGDLVGVCNVVEHLRKANDNPEIRFHIRAKATSADRNVQDFHSFLISQTDYFSAFEGQQSLPWRKVNLWDFRDICGDLVKIPNNKPMKKKIVIFPLFDAPYNVYRNWPRELLQHLIEKYSTEEYKDYNKVVCTKDPTYFGEEWINSTDILENLNHIMDAEIFIGGDTGTSHFAWALDRAPKDLIYYNSSRGLIHTLPFYLMQGKGRMTNYWMDFEGTTWQ